VKIKDFFFSGRHRDVVTTFNWPPSVRHFVMNYRT